jgi:hypothetical protein
MTAAMYSPAEQQSAFEALTDVKRDASDTDRRGHKRFQQPQLQQPGAAAYCQRDDLVRRQAVIYSSDYQLTSGLRFVGDDGRGRDQLRLQVPASDDDDLSRVEVTPELRRPCSRGSPVSPGPTTAGIAGGVTDYLRYAADRVATYGSNGDYNRYPIVHSSLHHHLELGENENGIHQLFDFSPTVFNVSTAACGGSVLRSRPLISAPSASAVALPSSMLHAAVLHPQMLDGSRESLPFTGATFAGLSSSSAMEHIAYGTAGNAIHQQESPSCITSLESLRQLPIVNAQSQLQQIGQLQQQQQQQPQQPQALATFDSFTSMPQFGYAAGSIYPSMPPQHQQHQPSFISHHVAADIYEGKCSHFK